ncbi:14321_t:CDS:2, partial [Entrophospora sp. SA101]
MDYGRTITKIFTAKPCTRETQILDECDKREMVDISAGRPPDTFNKDMLASMIPPVYIVMIMEQDLHINYLLDLDFVNEEVANVNVKVDIELKQQTNITLSMADGLIQLEDLYITITNVDSGIVTGEAGNVKVAREVINKIPKYLKFK